MRIFHIATEADWREAKRSGSYTTSTRGRTLAEEGFLHASRGDQWQGVQQRFYADVEEPLVLLAIDTELLASPVVEERVADSAETFPHIYGPLNTSAVVGVAPLDGSPVGEASFSRLFFEELFANLMLACLVLAVTVAGTLAGLGIGGDWTPIIGAGVGLLLGIALAILISRRRKR